MKNKYSHPFDHVCSIHPFLGPQSIGSNLIQVGPVSIVRIQQGQFGLAQNNHMFEILLPGTMGVLRAGCVCFCRM